MLNRLKFVGLCLAMFVGVAAYSGASATTICSGCDFTANPGAAASNLGVLNPTTIDQSSFIHSGIAVGAFSDWWVFTVSPAGTGSLNAAFLPTLSVTGFKVDLFTTTGPVCAAVAPGATNPGACSSFGTLGANVGTSTGAGIVSLSGLSLSGGYAFHIVGTSTDTSTLYTGNVRVAPTGRIPEPGSLALLALGVLALGAGLRHRA
jgi:hypothetical protein